jgi:hypothetical protein
MSFSIKDKCPQIYDDIILIDSRSTCCLIPELNKPGNYDEQIFFSLFTSYQLEEKIWRVSQILI